MSRHCCGDVLEGRPVDWSDAILVVQPLNDRTRKLSKYCHLVIELVVEVVGKP
jgi:hypothetical protein